jgi:predicted  nucleic acid-binding Zn-ribbon protein
MRQQEDLSNKYKLEISRLNDLKTNKEHEIRALKLRLDQLEADLSRAHQSIDII